MPAASSTVSASARTMSPIGPPRAGGPHTASIALPRLVISLRHFHREISGCATDEKSDDDSAAAVARAMSSTPVGNRPTSITPVIGAEWAITRPGARCTVGHMTVAPYTCSKRLSASRSLCTPFWRQTIGRSTGATADSASSTGTVSWLLTATSTTSSGPYSTASGAPITGTVNVTVRSGDATWSPSRAIAAPCSPRRPTTRRDRARRGDRRRRHRPPRPR